MKKSFFLLLVGVAFVTLNANAAPVMIPGRGPVGPVRGPVFSERDLPSRAREFLRFNFPRERVMRVDRTRFGHDVSLANGIMVQFNTRGDWQRVGARGRSSVPSHILPRRAQDTLDRQFRRTAIREIARQSWGFQVFLSGRGPSEVRFNTRGDVMPFRR